MGYVGDMEQKMQTTSRDWGFGFRDITPKKEYPFGQENGNETETPLRAYRFDTNNPTLTEVLVFRLTLGSISTGVLSPESVRLYLPFGHFLSQEVHSLTWFNHQNKRLLAPARAKRPRGRSGKLMLREQHHRDS